MFSAPSSHKRRRASARGDQARKRLPGRVVLNIAAAAAPQRLGETEDASTVTQDAEQRMRDVVHAHPFNHQISIIIPETAGPGDPSTSRHADRASQLSKHLKSVTSSSPATLATVPLQIFLDPEFVSQFVKGASLVALSSGKLESDDVICLDGQGSLTLHVAKDTYQTLGLTGRPSRFALGASGRHGDRKSGPNDRYLIEIPLADPTFRPGKPGWTRVSECFARWEATRGQLFTFIFAVQAGRDLLIPQHITCRGTPVRIPGAYEEEVIEDVWLPLLGETRLDGGLYESQWAQLRNGYTDESSSRLSWEDWSLSCADLAEWKALVDRDADCTRTYHRPSHLPLNSYEVPTPREAGRIRRIIISGFIHPSSLLEIEGLLRRHLDSLPESDSDSWLTISCTGFADSPIRWRSHDPGWGLALGKGRCPVDPQNAIPRGIFAHPSSVASTKRDQDRHYENLSDPDGNGYDQADQAQPRLESDSMASSDSETDSDSDDAESSPERLTGKAARRKRARKVKRKGHIRRGETERSGADTASGGGIGAGSSSQGGEMGWTAVLFSTSSHSAAGKECQQARYIWWENVDGDTRN